MKGKIAAGTIIGAVAGIIAGVLTAPKAGKDTRANLKERAAELKKKAQQHTNKIKPDK